MRLGREWIGKEVTVVMDRPLGSAHPDYADMIYPINYGYIPGTLAADGEAIDAYVLGPDKPLETFEGKVIAIVKRENDIEDKLVVASRSFPAEEIAAQVRFQEKRYISRVEI